MGVMIGAMMLMRRLDQEDPTVLMASRMAYAAYAMATLCVYSVLHARIIQRKDTTTIKVPIQRTPFTQVQESAPKEKYVTCMEYDLSLLSTSRKGWLLNTVILSLVHYKMETVSPLLMSALMGVVKLITDDPLFKLHILGYPAVDKLKRPFPPEPNPLAAFMKDLVPKQDADDNSQQPNGEELHDDGDSDDDDHAPPAIADLTDDHVRSEFDDDEEDVRKENGKENADKLKKNKPKKTK